MRVAAGCPTPSPVVAMAPLTQAQLAKTAARTHAQVLAPGQNQPAANPRRANAGHREPGGPATRSPSGQDGQLGVAPDCLPPGGGGVPDWPATELGTVATVGTAVTAATASKAPSRWPRPRGHCGRAAAAATAATAATRQQRQQRQQRRCAGRRVEARGGRCSRWYRSRVGARPPRRATAANSGNSGNSGQ